MDTQPTHPSDNPLAGVAWRTSSRSSSVGGNCVEAGALPDGSAVAVRDSKNRTGPALLYTPTAWTTFLTAIKHDHLTP